MPVGLANGICRISARRARSPARPRRLARCRDPTGERSDSTGSGITTKQIAQSGIAPLSLDAAGSYADGTATIKEAELEVGDGRLTAVGHDRRDARPDRYAVDDLPVGLVNGYLPDLGATGTISGDAKATGSLADPQARFDLTGSGITTSQIAQSGVAPFSLDAAGSYANGTATIGTPTSPSATARSRPPAPSARQLDLHLAIEALPVGLANGFVEASTPGHDHRLRPRPPARCPIRRPDFDLAGSGITTRQIAQSGVAPLVGRRRRLLCRRDRHHRARRRHRRRRLAQATGTVGERLDHRCRHRRAARRARQRLRRRPRRPRHRLRLGLGHGLALRSRRQLRHHGIRRLGRPGPGGRAPALQGRGGGPLCRRHAEPRQRPMSTSAAGPSPSPVRPAPTPSTSPPRSAPCPRRSPVAAAAGIDPQGTINGTVRATGAPSNPSVTYDINASGVSIQQTRAAGVGALAITTSGRFADQVVTTDTSLTGDGGIDFSASGSVNLAGGPQPRPVAERLGAALAREPHPGRRRPLGPGHRPRRCRA